MASGGGPSGDLPRFTRLALAVRRRHGTLCHHLPTSHNEQSFAHIVRTCSITSANRAPTPTDGTTEPPDLTDLTDLTDHTDHTDHTSTN